MNSTILELNFTEWDLIIGSLKCCSKNLIPESSPNSPPSDPRTLTLLLTLTQYSVPNKNQAVQFTEFVFATTLQAGVTERGKKKSAGIFGFILFQKFRCYKLLIDFISNFIDVRSSIVLNKLSVGGCTAVSPGPDSHVESDVISGCPLKPESSTHW